MADKKPAATTSKKSEAALPLSDQLAAKRSELLELKKTHAAGDLVNPRALTSAKKEVARLLTTINAGKEAK
jgi:ribosomal protein L29